MRNRFLFFLFFMIIGLSCSTKKELITVDGYTFEAFAGPNMIRISSNFYADQTEITNTFYKEFMHWMKSVYGINSQEYIDILPDVSVWNFQNHLDINGDEYFRNPEFNDYPMVGITLEQAKIYSEWRTDRVAEMLLIEQGVLNPNLSETIENCFTIERFRNGFYPLRNKNKIRPIFVYPRFTIPSVKEWEALAGIKSGFKYGIDSLATSNKKFLKNGNNAFHTFEDLNNKVDKKLYISRHEISPSLTMPTQYGILNIYGLYHTIGNVSELVDQPGLAKGGDWKHKLEDLDIGQNVKQNIPNCWTGFRCVNKLEIMNYPEAEPSVPRVK